MNRDSFLFFHADRVRRVLGERLDQATASTLKVCRSPSTVDRRHTDPNCAFAVITVNFSTTHYLKLLLLTLSEQENPSQISDIVVVDNRSGDGGRAFLRRLRDAIPRVTLVENNWNLSHARGMRLGISALDKIGSPADTILAVDTDVIFLRPDTISQLGLLFKHGAALAGEMRHGIYPVPEAQASFLAFSRNAYWRRDVSPWVNHGAPSYWMQCSMRRAGLKVIDFPSYRDGYALHRGRSGVLAAKTYYQSSSYASVRDADPHFMGIPNGEAIWSSHELRWSHLLNDPSREKDLIALVAERFSAT